MPLVHEAEVRWAAAGANVSALGNIQVSVVNLPGTELSESCSVVDTIYLDTNAQGWGWLIDPTPGQDNEFPVQVAKTEERATTGPAAGEMDLLTVIMHEMGHFLGYAAPGPADFPLRSHVGRSAGGCPATAGCGLAVSAGNGAQHLRARRTVKVRLPSRFWRRRHLFRTGPTE